jgi:hypothetical protein
MLTRDYYLWESQRREGKASECIDEIKTGESLLVLEEPTSFQMHCEETNWIITVLVLGPRRKGKIELFVLDHKHFIELPG